MEFWILGPLEVTSNGGRVELGYTKQQLVLGVLLLEANRVVSSERLVDELWGEAPPQSAPKLVQGYISGLRKVLGRETIETRSGGYLLRVDPDRLDAARFERLAAEAQRCDDDPERTGERLSSALSLWRGVPLAGLSFQSSARHEVARLAERRLAVLEHRIETELAAGRHVEQVPDLRELVAEHPYRERSRGHLMLALYRSGRQAEALAVYREGRHLLADRLALEPGAGLRELERQILRHDPALGGTPVAAEPPPAARRDGERPAERRRPHWPRMPLIAALAGVLAVGIAVPILIFGGDDSSGGMQRPAGNSVGLIDPRTGRFIEDIELGVAPGDVAVAHGAVWVANPNDGTITRIQPETRTIRQTIRVRTGPAGIAAGADAIWVANSLDGTVSKVSPETNEVVDTITVGNGPTGVAAGEGFIWVVNRDDRTVSRIDPDEGRVGKTVPAGADPVDVAAGAGAVWVTSRSEGSVLKLDPARGKVVDVVNVGRGPAAVAASPGVVWVANALDGTVSRIDPADAVVRATIPVGAGPTALDLGAGAVWVGHEGSGAVSRVDPITDAVARRLRVGRPLAGLAANGSGLYVSALPSGGPHRGGTLRVLWTTRSLESVDPAIAYDVLSWDVLQLAHDGLTAFKHVPGSAGAQLVPNLATSLPAPVDAGRTYTFELREGVRYSSGERVQPTDFRRALERLFKSRSDAASLYTSVTGARACVRRPIGCSLSAGVIANDDAGTVTFHLSEPDVELPNKLALPPAAPVPDGSSTRGQPSRPVPGTGPYKIASYVRGRHLRLVRNPHFREWSRVARPDGYVDEIFIALGISERQQVRDVVRGNADVAYAPLTEHLASLRSRYADRVHSNPGPGLWYLSLNENTEPFDDVRVRRALNHAVDRSTIARSLGGSFGAAATCQVLPPGFPGHRPYCPYAHDLEKARRLVAASGTEGVRVVVWTSPLAAALTSRVVAALRRLGYRARLRLVQEDEPWINARPRRVVVQAAQEAWAADYPAASAMVQPFRCAYRTPNLPTFCDEAVERTIDRALELQTLDSQAANDLWERVDKMIVNRAAAVPLANPRRVDFLAERVGNYQYHPLWGMLMDQLWVTGP
jgi:YVTN family beta-propeller protein